MIKHHKATASSKAARRLEIAIEQWGGSQRVAAKKEKAEETKRSKTKEAKRSEGEEVKCSKVKQEQEIIVEKVNQFKRADLCIV